MLKLLITIAKFLSIEFFITSLLCILKLDSWDSILEKSKILPFPDKVVYGLVLSFGYLPPVSGSTRSVNLNSSKLLSSINFFKSIASP